MTRSRTACEYEYLIGSAHRDDPRGDTTRMPPPLAAPIVEHSPMYARSNGDPKFLDSLRDCKGAIDGARRSVEGRDKPVADDIDLGDAEPIELVTHYRAKTTEEVVPGLVAELNRPRRVAGYQVIGGRPSSASVKRVGPYGARSRPSSDAMKSVGKTAANCFWSRRACSTALFGTYGPMLLR